MSCCGRAQVGAAQRDRVGIWPGADGAVQHFAASKDGPWALGDGSSAAPHHIQIFLKQAPPQCWE